MFLLSFFLSNPVTKLMVIIMKCVSFFYRIVKFCIELYPLSNVDFSFSFIMLGCSVISA